MSDSRDLETRHRERRSAGATRGVLLLGADGMLGRAMHAELTSRGWPVTAPTAAEFDLSTRRSINNASEWRDWFDRGAVIINCAAWTDVDGAESHEREATAVNGDAIEGLAGLCAEWDARLVTFSTDYVFDGAGTVPYPVDAARAPLNAYGRSKAAGEAALERFRHGWLNIRTSWLYAPWGKNFVLTMQKLLHEKPSIRVVNDQRGRPTSAEHLARTALALLDRGQEGHWHVTDGGECSWFEFAQEVGTLLKAPGKVEPCTSAEFPRPAKRPAYSVLDVSRTEVLLGAMPDWRANLADVVGRLLT